VSQRTGLRAVVAAVPGLLRDGAGLAGAGLVAYGAWLVFPPAGFIVAGVLLLTGACLIARAPEPPTEQR
jgi:hypothetical protein